MAQHAFTSELAYGRPGWSDLFEAKTFAKKISVKLKDLTGVAEPVTVPGDPQAPYYVPLGADGQPVNFLKAKPKTKLSRCNGCGACKNVAPADAVAGSEGMIHVIKDEAAVKNAAFIASCPVGAIKKYGTVKPACPLEPMAVGTFGAAGGAAGGGRRRRRG